MLSLFINNFTSQITTWLWVITGPWLAPGMRHGSRRSLESICVMVYAVVWNLYASWFTPQFGIYMRHGLRRSLEFQQQQQQYIVVGNNRHGFAVYGINLSILHILISQIIVSETRPEKHGFDTRCVQQRARTVPDTRMTSETEAGLPQKQKRVFLVKSHVFILHSNQLWRLFITRPFPVCADPPLYSTPFFSVILSRPRQSSRDITLNISNWRLFVQIHRSIQFNYFQSSSPSHVNPPSRFACTLERSHVSHYGYIQIQHVIPHYHLFIQSDYIIVIYFNLLAQLRLQRRAQHPLRMQVDGVRTQLEVRDARCIMFLSYHLVLRPPFHFQVVPCYQICLL